MIVGAESGAEDSAWVRDGWTRGLAGRGVPYPRGSVAARCDHAPAIRAEGGPVYGLGVLEGRADPLAGTGVPKLSFTVLVGGNNTLPVGAELRVLDVAVKHAQLD